MSKARLIDITHPHHHQLMVQILLDGGIVGTLWGHHLYILTCNALSQQAVARMNLLKNRSPNQVLVSPGAVEEAEELADIRGSPGLLIAASQMGMTPLKYLELLFSKFPLGVELKANKSTPTAVTNASKEGRTIWIAGHLADKSYSQLLQAVRNLRRQGKKIVFAGTSLNLVGENTLTVKQLDQVVAYFGDKIDAISVHPKAKYLKKVRYGTSCSAVSFVSNRPKVLRIGATSVTSLRKYIPDLEVPSDVPFTRKH